MLLISIEVILKGRPLTIRNCIPRATEGLPENSGQLLPRQHWNQRPSGWFSMATRLIQSSEHIGTPASLQQQQTLLSEMHGLHSKHKSQLPLPKMSSIFFVKSLAAADVGDLGTPSSSSIALNDTRANLLENTANELDE